MHSRRLRASSAVVPCSQRWPVLINHEHRWWRRPGLKAVEAPARTARGDEVVDVLYTAKQLEEWKRAITFPDEKETLPSVLTAGLCDQADGCPWMEHSHSRFSLSKLERQAADGLFAAVVPEPFASIIQHFHSVNTALLWLYLVAISIYLGCTRSRDRRRSDRVPTEPTANIQVGVMSGPAPAAAARHDAEPRAEAELPVPTTVETLQAMMAAARGPQLRRTSGRDIALTHHSRT